MAENGTPAVTEYVWANERLLGVKTGEDTLRLLYQGDSCIGFVRNNTDVYLYVKNLQGDVTGIADKTGTVVVSYTYDAWGNLLTQSGDAAIAKLNPITYRGYNYDAETGLYYLQSRYYNPEWGRFMNGDNVIDTNMDTGSCNLFTYCGNSPVNRIDTTGHFWELLLGLTRFMFIGYQFLINLFLSISFLPQVNAIIRTKWGLPNLTGELSSPALYDWEDVYQRDGYMILAFRNLGYPSVEEYFCETKTTLEWVQEMTKGYNKRSALYSAITDALDFVSNSGAAWADKTAFASNIVQAFDQFDQWLSSKFLGKRGRYIRDMLILEGVYIRDKNGYHMVWSLAQHSVTIVTKLRVWGRDSYPDQPFNHQKPNIWADYFDQYPY